jgi:DNA-binding NarL/FixJ family response regulator
MSTEVRIIIADDHPIFRAGLKQTIESSPGLKVIAEADDGATALALALEHQPDVVVLDLNMPKMTGFQVAEELRKKRLATRVVFLTMHDDEAMFNKAMTMDVKGYVLKDSAAVDIVNCLNAVIAGRNFTSPALTTYLFKRATRQPLDKTGTLADLTPTERTILRKIAEYKTSKEIGEELCISYRTVENYRTSICSKLDLHGSHSLIKFALQHQNEL